jgi:CheY-like chemotaxis protein
MARILVVDDEVSVRLTIKTILEREGNAVVLAECGHDGADAIEAYAFDMAIVDIFMPGMNGIETIRTFRQCAPGLPIVAMSGQNSVGSAGSPDFFRMALDLGAVCCLRKPFRPADLLAAVDACRPAAACRVA